MSVSLTSFTGAKLETTSESGATCLCAVPSGSLHTVCIEQESLPTGMETPSFGQNLRPTSWTVS